MPSFTGYSDDIDPEKVIKNSPFWPDMNLSEFQEVYRLPAEYREKLLEERLGLAMVWANKQLADWRIEQQADGISKLADVPVDENIGLGAGNHLVSLYTRAVSCRAKAELLADYATMMRKSDAVNDAKEAPETADGFHRMASDALAELQDKPLVHVELL